jgi:hypothetical protein
MIHLVQSIFGTLTEDGRHVTIDSKKFCKPCVQGVVKCKLDIKQAMILNIKEQQNLN